MVYVIYSFKSSSQVFQALLAHFSKFYCMVSAWVKTSRRSIDLEVLGPLKSIISKRGLLKEAEDREKRGRLHPVQFNTSDNGITKDSQLGSPSKHFRARAVVAQRLSTWLMIKRLWVQISPGYGLSFSTAISECPQRGAPALIFPLKMYLAVEPYRPIRFNKT